MNKKELEAFAKEAAKSFKTEKDLSDFSRMLKKVTIEAALNAELDDHLGYDKHQSNTNKIVVMVRQAKAFIPTTAQWKLRCRVIVTAPLSLS